MGLPPSPSIGPHYPAGVSGTMTVVIVAKFCDTGGACDPAGSRAEAPQQTIPPAARLSRSPRQTGPCLGDAGRH
ncbi:hypothetical protein Pelo_1122 [Pelomyxa schiedti]|nr:hypothetical protein Pelo_1122 [Pelomyxa schiedti]